MGFFSDLFKENTKWNDNEIKALYAMLVGIAGVDGNADDKEILLLSKIVSKLVVENKNTTEYWSNVAKAAKPDEMPKHIAILKSMHSKKREHVIAALSMVALEDGKVDPSELKILNGMVRVLK